MKEIENLYEYIDAMKQRPSMFLGEQSLSALYFHVKGYETACNMKGIEEKLEPDFYLFHDFVANYYLRSESTAGWRNIILAENFGDEKSALENFFALFDSFRKDEQTENSKKILFCLLEKIILNQNNSNVLKEQFSVSDFDKLKKVLNKIGSVEFSFDYDDILKEVRDLTSKYKCLQDLLVDVKIS